MSAQEDSSGTIDRRTYLSALATSMAAGLAGCGGGGGSGDGDGGDSGGDSGDGSGDQELGERVPELTGVALSQLTGAENIEQTMLHIAQQVDDVLGVPMDVEAKEFVSFFEEMQNDERTAHMHVNLVIPVATRLDPGFTLRGYHIRNAGTNVTSAGLNNWANCDFSRAVEQQAYAANPEERQEYVTEALETGSQEVVPIPLTQTAGGAAYRSDQLTLPDDLGDKGIIESNAHFLHQTESNGDTEYLSGVVTPGNMPNAVYHLGVKRPWFNTVYFPLVYYDKNYNLQPGIAEDYDVTDEFSTFTFNLRQDATFHNGEPVTAEDARWTLEWIEENTAQFSFVPQYNYDSLTAVDEHTLEVSFENPNPGWLNVFAPAWSSPLPKQHWIDAGAEDGPRNMSLDTIVGCGPYEVESWQPRELLAMQPVDDHWLDVADKGLRFVGYGDRQAAFRAFEDETVNVLFNASGQTQQRVEEDLSDVAEYVSSRNFTSWHVQSTHSTAPTMFREFREAVSWSIDRQRARAFLENGAGEIETKSSWFPRTHPSYPEDDSNMKTVGDPTANPDQARQILEDAGWGWDDEGRLHYPPDKDLTPPWPEDSSPCENPDSWPCLPELCDNY
ncbi:ABC transporter substrate-binding protein [Halobellus salinisoli]|uniref:ABC transporter substrate-binding protein n=1 Tax=Halobellus salinisoli TaxID=3108500 RepID=UPI00300B6180